MSTQQIIGEFGTPQKLYEGDTRPNCDLAYYVYI